MLNDINTATSFFSAIVALLSFLATVYSLFLTKKENKNNIKNTFKVNYIKKLDECYMVLSEYIEEYTTSRTSKKKVIARENIIFRLSSLEGELSSYPFKNDEVEDFYYKITLKVSDITYEDNFDKNMRDLKYIQNDIAELKQMIENL